VSVEQHLPNSDAVSLRDLARIPDLRALLIDHAGRGFRVQSIVRGALAIFVVLTVVLVPPAGVSLPALLIAAAYCVWTVAVSVAVRVNSERVLRLNWIALVGDVVALGLVTLTAAGADRVSWTGDVLLNGFFLIPVLAAVQLRVWVAVTAIVPTIAVFLVCSAIARLAESQPWSYVLLRVLALGGLSIGCVLLVRVQSSRVLAIGNTVAHRGALLTELLETESRERAELSEDLHDGALQYILAARQDLGDLPASTDPALRKRLAEALAEASGMLRSQVSRLTPAILDQAGLAAAIRRLADDAAQRGRFISELDATAWPNEPTVADRLLFDCARELLTNVVRHADARSVRVSLSRTENSASLVVADDGVGLDPASTRTQLRAGHVGLATRRIRVDAAGGRLTMTSSPGGGTTVTVRVPIPSWPR
jgi:two-component system, NarL family, sensor kinase